MAQQCNQASGAVPGCGSKGFEVHQNVKDYYGKHLKTSDDLKTNACAKPAKPLPEFISDALKEVHEEVLSRYYGCGQPIPECLENCWILDLGSGSGRDCYMLSKLVGEKGHVTGIDMTDEQVQLAKKYIGYHTQTFGYQEPNVDFIQGYIEKLGEAGLKEKSYDIVISNCVINLSPDKRAVLEEAYKVLKDGGEMYFSDMYANLDLPEEIRKNKVLWGEGLAGAIWWEDLYRIAQEIGFCPPRLVTARYITVHKELEDLIGDYKYASATFRLFKVPKDEPKDEGLAIYKGGIRGYEEELQFDANFTFKKGEAVQVDEETARILKNSRFADQFLIQTEADGTSPASGETFQETIIDPFKFAEYNKT